MTVEDIYKIPPDEYGWRTLPNGDGVKLGNGVKLGDGVTLGNCVTLGDGVKLGDDVTLGDGVTLRDGVTLGDWVTLGDDVTLGDGVTLRDGVTSDALNIGRILALQAAGRPLLFWKWVQPNRESPCFHGGKSCTYLDGKVVTATGDVSDQQCAAGLHVVDIGVMIEHIGNVEPGHDYIPLLVEVDPAHLLHCPWPGTGGKWRVSQLRVIGEAWKSEGAKA